MSRKHVLYLSIPKSYYYHIIVYFLQVIYYDQETSLNREQVVRKINPMAPKALNAMHPAAWRHLVEHYYNIYTISM